MSSSSPFEWYFIDYAQGEYREIGDSDVSHYYIMSNGSLLVQRARLQDEGYYLCQVDNGFGPGLSEPVLLTVNGKLTLTLSHDLLSFSAESENMLSRVSLNFEVVVYTQI